MAVLNEADVVEGAADHGGADIGQTCHGQKRAVVPLAEPGRQQGEHHDLPGKGVDHRGQDVDDEIAGNAGQTGGGQTLAVAAHTVSASGTGLRFRQSAAMRMQKPYWKKTLASYKDPLSICWGIRANT